MKWLNKLPLIIAIFLLGYGFLNAKNPNSKSNLHNNDASSLPLCDIYKIWDGDTSRASCNGQEIKVRCWAYDQFKSDCQVWNAVESAQQEAVRKKLGIWASDNPTAPWDWRKNHR